MTPPMQRPIVTVTNAVFYVDGEPWPLACTLVYDLSDPMAVTFQFELEVELNNGEVVTDRQCWALARDLLDSSMSRPGQEVGDGFVRLRLLIDRNVLMMTLLDSSRDAPFQVFVEADPIPHFMAASLRMAPVGQEHIDIDAELEALLGESS